MVTFKFRHIRNFGEYKAKLYLPNLVAFRMALSLCMYAKSGASCTVIIEPIVRLIINYAMYTVSHMTK